MNEMGRRMHKEGRPLYEAGRKMTSLSRPKKYLLRTRAVYIHDNCPNCYLLLPRLQAQLEIDGIQATRVLYS